MTATERSERSRTSGDTAIVSFWERSWTVFERWAPHVLLALSIAVSLVADARPAATRPTTLGLAALAAAWVVVGHTRNPGWPHQRPWFAWIYVTGLIAWATVLMSRDTAFFIFAISGFLHAYLLRPKPLVFAGTGATSFVIQAMTWEGGFPQPTTEGNALFIVLVLLQAVLIGFGVLGGERQTEMLAQRRETVRELEAILAENEGLQAQLVSQAREAGIADERGRLAREIHDTLAQGLAGIITQLEAAAQTQHDPTALQRHIDAAARLARHSLDEARRSVHALDPGELDDGRLADALEDVTRDWSERSAIRTHVTITGARDSLPTEVEVGLLRVAQEALANVAKHADATRVGVTLSRLDDRIMLDVRDDGCGFDPATTPNGSAGAMYGLTSMHHRIDDLGGTLTIESGDGAGTAICASVPLPTTKDADA